MSTIPAAQQYAFLAQPPASKRRVMQPTSTSEHDRVPLSENVRRRSAPSTAINAWASSVQPGPPAPISPTRLEFSSTETRSSSRSTRRKSVMPAPPSPVAYIPAQEDSPTSSSHTITPPIKPDAKHDLPSVGYTSIFVTLPPKTSPPEYTPDRRRSLAVPRSAAPVVPPSSGEPAAKPSGFSRLRSLSIKPSSSHSRSKSTAESSKSKPSPAATSVTKDKKSKYAEMRPAQVSTELALAQFMGGGAIEHHMKQYAKAQAKAAGASAVNGQLVGVGELHRDGQGVIWRDQEEEWEYTHLLGANAEAQMPSGHGDWVQFDEERGVGAFDEERRGSVSTQDSDLDPRYAVAEVDPLDTSALPLSSRAHNTAKHLRKNTEFDSNVFASSRDDARLSGKHRRRPEPLTLVPQNASQRVRPSNPLDSNDARRDFFESSFSPAPKPVFSSPNPSSATVDSYGAKKSVFKGLFKSKKATRA